mmetsp:Transcript_61461/g.127415  ORF Transcript_61461/g.127415 Transcript_61461/m.127415 type:complete len:87 (-) Transcript_61461:145-405(-)
MFAMASPSWFKPPFIPPRPGPMTMRQSALNRSEAAPRRVPGKTWEHHDEGCGRPWEHGAYPVADIREGRPAQGVGSLRALVDLLTS